MLALDARNFLLGVKWRGDFDVTQSEDFPFCLPVVRSIEQIELRTPVTFFVGENGSGKSTVLEAMAILAGCNPEGGSQNFNFSTATAHQNLHLALRPVRSAQRPRTRYFLRAESYFNVATELARLDREGGGPPLTPAYGGVPLHEQSHGESFLALIQNRFRPGGLYFLDEPEAALSPNRQLMLLSRMRQLVGQGSQFIIASHSPIVLAYPYADLYLFSQAGARRVAYRETEHYRVTRDFLSDPEATLAKLFAPIEDEEDAAD